MMPQSTRKRRKEAEIIVTKQPGFQRAHCLGEQWRGGDGGCGIKAVSSALLHLICFETKDKDILGADIGAPTSIVILFPSIGHMDHGPVL